MCYIGKIIVGLWVCVLLIGCDGGIIKNEEFTRNANGNSDRLLKDITLPLNDGEYLSVILPSANARYNQGFLQNLTETKVHLSKKTDDENKVLMLVFFTTWCEPCLAQIPHFNNLRTLFGDSVEMVGILVKDETDMQSMEQFMQNQSLSFPYVLNSDNALKTFFKNLGQPDVIPLTVLYDKEGNFFTYYLGAVLEEMAELDIQRLLDN